MKKNIERILRFLVIFWGVYLTFEGILYFFNIRLADVKNIWPTSAALYSELIGKVLGSMFLFTAAIVFDIQRNLLKYRNFIKLSMFWGLFHGGVLIWLSLSNNYVEVFKNWPSLYLWSPFYNQYVTLEGVVLIGYSVLVYLWLKDTK